ncbi:MAG TPA: hypothetical protein VGP47_08050 [Parachlamydiaceae bacterium]|nr:hypothetical protein [Parachlamydiaceae bacterium]
MNLPISTAIARQVILADVFPTGNSDLQVVLKDEGHAKSRQTYDKVIEKAKKILANITLPLKTFDLEPSMVDRVRALTEDSLLRVAETLSAIAGKLGLTDKIFFEKLPVGILAMPSPHDRRVKDEALILKSTTMLNSLNALTTSFKELQKGIEDEMERLADKAEFPTFIDPLREYQHFYKSTIAEVKTTLYDCTLLVKDLGARNKLEIKGNKERKLPSEDSLGVFSLCYGLKPMEILTAIVDLHERSDKISKFISELKKTQIFLEKAINTFRDKYNFLAHLFLEEIHYNKNEVNDKTIFEAFNKHPRNYLESLLVCSKQGK